MNADRLGRLLYEALETEKGGVRVYETALRCARNPELREEWERYLEQTRRHVTVVTRLLEKARLDPEGETPGQRIVRAKAKALVDAMHAALETGDAEAAQVVAAECVVDAETKDHLNWELIGEAAKEVQAALSHDLKEAFAEVQEEEDEHLYHTMGWARELHIQALGLPAVFPPPEERARAKSAEVAARAKESRSRMLGRRGPRRPAAAKGKLRTRA